MKIWWSNFDGYSLPLFLVNKALKSKLLPGPELDRECLAPWPLTHSVQQGTLLLFRSN